MPNYDIAPSPHRSTFGRLSRLVAKELREILRDAHAERFYQV